MNSFSGKIKFEVLFEDDDLFVLNKQAAIHSVMLTDSDLDDSVAKYLNDTFPFLREVSDKVEDGALVHRLDFDTSGCLLGAKKRSVWLSLFEALKNGEIHKTYLALVEGRLITPRHLETFIGAKGRHSKKVQVVRDKRFDRTLPAVSDFFPLKFYKESDTSLVLAKAPTARRHQIRAHLSYIGFPLIGDILYGSKRKFEFSDKRSFFLHAKSLKFKHPVTGEGVIVEAPHKEFEV
ncbi:MAG: RluA family pseudouridine synthase [Bdellovibrionota bacterium]|jgi:23S rRNA-/tRNA-specific pseudouridylate synthase